MDSNGDIVASDDTAGKTPDANGAYPFTLTGIPVGVDVKVYLIEFGIYPVYFDSTGGDSPDTNVFSLTSAVTVDLGFLDIHVSGQKGRAIPEKSPTETSGISAGTEDTSIPPGINEPDTTGLSLSKLLSNGLDALKDGSVLRARQYFEAAESLAGTATSNDADTARFYYALTRIAALGFDTYSDGDSSYMNQLGDFLDRLGCDKLDTARASFDGISFPETIMPSNSPSGGELQNFLHNVVRPELEGAIANLVTVSTSFNKRWTEPFDNESVESDYGDVVFFRAIAKSAASVILIQYAYDLDADIDETVNNDKTIEQFLADNSSFLTLTNGDLDSAKGYLAGALDDLDAAIVWMDQETDSQHDDLISLADMTTEEIDEARAGIATAKECLDGQCTVDDNDTPSDTADDTIIDPSKFFEGIDLRALLPPFTGDVPGYFPDPTMGGIIVQGIDVNEDIDPADGIPDILQ